MKLEGVETQGGRNFSETGQAREGSNAIHKFSSHPPNHQWPLMQGQVYSETKSAVFDRDSNRAGGDGGKQGGIHTFPKSISKNGKVGKF